MTIDNDDNDFNHEVGRNDSDDESTTTNPTAITATTAMATPVGRNDMCNVMATMGNAIDNASSTTSMMNNTSVASTARCVQFHDQPMQQLMW